MEAFWLDFHFLRPWYLFLLLPLAYVVWRWQGGRSTLGSWKKICEPALLAYLQVGRETKSSAAPLWWLGISGILAVTALAGPVWQHLPQPIYREQSALVIMLDLSRSMDATDLKPSRLTRAKQKIIDLLALRHEGQTALVVFAGSSFVVTPLTEDTKTILAQLQGLSTDIMPVQGGNLDAAMAKGIQILAQASVKHGQMLLFTDSDAYARQQVQALTQAGHNLSIIGVGTQSGAPIARASGGFLTDNQGNIVVPKLKVGRLQDLAKQGHGVYRQLAWDDSDIQPILRLAAPAMWDKKQEKSLQTSDQWREEGAWLLLLLLPLALLGFRRGVLALALCMWCMPQPGYAFAWQDMWQSQDQQAAALMATQDYAKAADRFDDPSWQAAAAYKNKDYQAAFEALDSLAQPSADDLYNKGNALAQLGQLDAAIAAYDAALQQNPKLGDAQVNKTLLQTLKNQQKKQQKPNDKPRDSKKEQKQQQNKQASDKKGQKQQGKDAQPQDKQQGKPSAAQEAEDQAAATKKKPEQGEQGKQNEQKDEESQQKQSQGKDKQAEQEKKAQQARQQAVKPKLSAEDIEKSEAKQAFEQSLRRIPDDPAGLLRRKFKYQYQQRGQPQQRDNLW